jgi:hypothetical protein
MFSLSPPAPPPAGSCTGFDRNPPTSLRFPALLLLDRAPPSSPLLPPSQRATRPRAMDPQASPLGPLLRAAGSTNGLDRSTQTPRLETPPNTQRPSRSTPALESASPASMPAAPSRPVTPIQDGLCRISTAPATKTTVVTTTTTTTVNFPPFMIKKPRFMRDRDPKQFPLAAKPVPSTLRRFTFAMGGQAGVFEEAGDPEAALNQVLPPHAHVLSDFCSSRPNSPRSLQTTVRSPRPSPAKTLPPDNSTVVGLAPGRGPENRWLGRHSPTSQTTRLAGASRGAAWTLWALPMAESLPTGRGRR